MFPFETVFERFFTQMEKTTSEIKKIIMERKIQGESDSRL
jgi:hypothetical protein